MRALLFITFLLVAWLLIRFAMFLFLFLIGIAFAIAGIAGLVWLAIESLRHSKDN